MSKADQLAAALDELLAVSPDVEAAAVVSADGLPMASALPPYVEEDRLAAMSAALLTLGERAASGLGKGHLAQVFVEASQGYVVLMSAGENAVLVCVTSGDAKAGLVLFEMRKGAAQVAQIMDGPAQVPVAEVDDRTPAEKMLQSAMPAPAAPGPPANPEAPAADTVSTWH
jgi:uncharacterized protein